MSGESGAALDIVSDAYLIDIQEFDLGGAGHKGYHAVKHYRRRKRWLA